MTLPISPPGQGPQHPWAVPAEPEPAAAPVSEYAPGGWGTPEPGPQPAPVAEEAYPHPSAGHEAAAGAPAGAPVGQPPAAFEQAPMSAGGYGAPTQPVAPAQPVTAPAEQEFAFGGPSASGFGSLPADVVAAARLLMQVIGDDESSEVIINGPNEVLQKIKGQRYHIPQIKFGDAKTYHRVLNEFLLPHCDTRDRIDEVNVLVEGQMELPSEQAGVPPMLARVHILCPPLVQFAKVTIAKKARYEFDLDGIARTGSMTQPMAEFLKAVAHGRLTTVVSGPTGAGKTTLLQAMTRHYDSNDRIIVIEDTPELRLPLADVVYLCSTTSKPGVKSEDVVSTEWLVKAANRMRMDRILVGECRGGEMAEWLIAANSGADGSATTVHADNPRRALDKILGLATKAPTAASEATLRREIAATVDIIVQAGLVDGKHVITHIEEVSNTIRQDNQIIATQTLFAYDRSTGRHLVKTRPSDELTSTLHQRGVPVDPRWFQGAQA